MEPITIIREFINDRPIMAGYVALMLALAMTGRWRFVVSGFAFGFAVFYCIKVGTAATQGMMEIRQVAIAAGISTILVVCAIKFAFR